MHARAATDCDIVSIARMHAGLAPRRRMVQPERMSTYGTRARSRIQRLHAHVIHRSVAAAAAHRRPAGILGGADGEPEQVKHRQSERPYGSTPPAEHLEAFRPDPAEVRRVGPQSKFSAQEYRDKGFTGPVRLFSGAQASAVAAAFLREPPLTNKQALSQRSQGTKKPPSTHPATWNETLPIAKDVGLLNLAEEILGPDVVLWATVFWHKPPCSEGYIPWQCVANHVEAGLLVNV